MKVGPDANEVADRIARLVTWARRYAPVEISSTAVTTLDTLQACGPLPISELARRERVSQPGMTSLVNRLATAGQAERVADPSDGLVALVCITEAGRHALADRQAARAEGLSGAVGALAAADRQALIDALPALDRLITAQPDTSAGPGQQARQPELMKIRTDEM